LEKLIIKTIHHFRAFKTQMNVIKK